MASLPSRGAGDYAHYAYGQSRQARRLALVNQHQALAELIRVLSEALGVYPWPNSTCPRD